MVILVCCPKASKSPSGGEYPGIFLREPDFTKNFVMFGSLHLQFMHPTSLYRQIDLSKFPGQEISALRILLPLFYPSVSAFQISIL
jgi:hypothetical protein